VKRRPLRNRLFIVPATALLCRLLRLFVPRRLVASPSPPSTTTTWPVTYAELASAHDDVRDVLGVPLRFNGATARTYRATVSQSSVHGVSMSPGATALTRTSARRPWRAARSCD